MLTTFVAPRSAATSKLDELRADLAGADPLRAELTLSEVFCEARRLLQSGEPWREHGYRLGKLLLTVETAHVPALRADVLILLAEWCAHNADCPFAVLLLEHALHVTTAANALSSQRRVLNVLGAVHNRSKNVTEASVCFVKALKLTEQIGDRLGRCAVLANLAALRITMGMLDDAIKLCTLVIELCGDEPLFTQVRSQAHQNLAEAYLYVADLPAAEKHARAALSIFPPSDTHAMLTNRVILELTCARVVARLNLTSEIDRHAHAAVETAARAGTFTATTQAQLALALSESANGSADVAFTRLAKIRQTLEPNDVSFRDLIEIELLAMQVAGRQDYIQYYSKRYLFSLAEFQRKSAIEQLAAMKARMKSAYQTTTLGIHRAAIQPLERFAQEMTALATLAVLREDATGEHSYRVGRLSRMLAIHLGFSDEDATAVEMAARLHDLGKLATPDAILMKRGSLTLDETAVVRRHSNEGCQMLTDMLYTVNTFGGRDSASLCQYLRVAAEVAQNHHEWWDGNGYPRGIFGTEIPEAARIVAIADVYDELTHTRPYKDESTKADAAAQIEALSGRQFEPQMCSAFLALIQNLSDLAREPEVDPSPFAAANRVIQRLAASAPV
jgi:putative two-component system response regulator